LVLADVDRLAWIGAVTFSTTCERNPAKPAATEAPRMTVPHNAAKAVNRRGLITHRPLLRARLRLSRAAQISVETSDFFGSRSDHARKKTAGYCLFLNVLPKCNPNQISQLTGGTNAQTTLLVS
jgi:hypothetical protein